MSKAVKKAISLPADLAAEAEAKRVQEALMKVKKELEAKQRALLANRLEREERARALIRDRQEQIEAVKRAVEEARKQPKSEEEETQLADRYGAMELGEKAFAILVDLGMVEVSPDPSSPDYDSSRDDKYVK